MKIHKLLPIAVALMMVSPAFASTSSSQSSTLELTVPKFINITKDSTSVDSATASYNDDYTALTLDKSITQKFKIITNNPDEKVKLTATALEGGSDVNALYGTATAPVLVFTNTGSDARAAKSGAIAKAAAGDKTADSANAIAFALTPTITPDTTSGAKTPTATKNDEDITYELTANGIYSFQYVSAKTATGFSTHDTDGTYKATIVLSQIASGS